jgi:hypothetical protein
MVASLHHVLCEEIYVSSIQDTIIYVHMFKIIQGGQILCYASALT